MPIRKADTITEHRMTLGKVERQALSDLKTIGAISAIAPVAGSIAVGAGVALAAYIFVNKGFDLLKDVGASQETRIAVNQAVDNSPADSMYTPAQFEGMSAGAIYQLGHDVQEELNGVSYRAWLEFYSKEDVGVNWMFWQGNNDAGFDWGSRGVAWQPIRVAGGAGGLNAEGETEYSAFAYQMAIRETASRRRQISMVGGGPLGVVAGYDMSQAVASIVGSSGWRSQQVSQAPGYVSDPLLWCAWARVNFPGETSAFAGADSPVAISYYIGHVVKSIGWEQEMFDLHAENVGDGFADFKLSQKCRDWWPTDPPPQ